MKRRNFLASVGGLLAVPSISLAKLKAAIENETRSNNYRQLCKKFGWPEPKVSGEGGYSGEGGKLYSCQPVLTPEVAAKLITQEEHIHPSTRVYPTDILRAFAENIRKGTWDTQPVTGPIEFDETCKLYEGKSILAACVLSDTPVCVYVRFGIPRSPAGFYV